MPLRELFNRPEFDRIVLDSLNSPNQFRCDLQEFMEDMDVDCAGRS